MNTTTGNAAELQRARIRARDAIFDWARDQPEMRGMPLYVQLVNCPHELAQAYRAALQAWADLS